MVVPVCSGINEGILFINTSDVNLEYFSNRYQIIDIGLLLMLKIESINSTTTLSMTFKRLVRLIEQQRSEHVIHAI